MNNGNKVKALFVDDETEKMIPVCAKLNNNKMGVEVTLESPLKFDEAVEFMPKIALAYDAILTDYKLNGANIIKNELSYNTKYTGIVFAQVFRELVSENKVAKDIPIILTSKDEYFRDSFNKEITGHDLFDWRVTKDDLSNHSETVCKVIHSLIHGYKTISNFLHSRNKDYLVLFGIHSSEMYPSISVVMDSYLDKGYKPHAFSNFIIKKLIRFQGALISEELLAAKLGIDISKSNDWEKLCEEKLNNVRYKGVFWELEKRFWLHRLDEWWNTIDSYNYYENISATERVDLIKNNTGLQQLVAAKPIEEGYSDYYDTICILSKKPLSKEDSFLVASESQEPWQLRDYISIFYKLDNENYFSGRADDIHLDSSEFEKFEAIKKNK